MYDQLAILFNQSFSSGIFPSISKTIQIIPIYKKVSKSECSNYKPISFLSNIDENLERRMYNRLHNFLEKRNYIFTPIWFLTEMFYHSCSNSPHR